MKAIISSDIHIRPDLPRCRIDSNWEETQRLMIEEIINIANKYNIPLCIVGDLFDSGSVPDRLINMLLNEFSKINKKVYFIAGNHDLPYHSITNVNNSSIGILISLLSNHKKIEHGMPCGVWHDFNCEILGEGTIFFTHRLVFKSLKSIPPNCTGVTAQQLIDEVTEINSKIQWIFTGDNHKNFHYENNGIHVVNPGCTIRQSVDEISYKPSVFYVDTEKEIVERIYLSDNAEMVDDSYIKNENERDERIGAFIQGIKKSKKVSLSIIENIDKAIENNKDNLDKDTIKIIRELVEDNGEVN